MRLLTRRVINMLALSDPWRCPLALFVMALLISGPLAAQTGANGIDPQANSAQFVIYFSFNSTRLSRNSLAEISRAAAAIAEQGATRVLVTGHADAVGDETYNLILSMRRAQSVIDRLKSRGAAPTVIHADWKGEFDPAVPDVPNMPTPANRRVEIELQFTR